MKKIHMHLELQDSTRVGKTGQLYTCILMDRDEQEYYTWSNTPALSMTNAELYKNARVSPISYYGFCLENGNYIRKLVLKNFNIANEAGGAGKAVIKRFTTLVTSNTLEIHFYWAEKGTTDFTPLWEKGSGMSAGPVAAIVITGAIIFLPVFGIPWWRGCLGQKSSLARGPFVRWNSNSSETTFF